MEMTIELKVGKKIIRLSEEEYHELRDKINRLEVERYQPYYVPYFPTQPNYPYWTTYTTSGYAEVVENTNT